MKAPVLGGLLSGAGSVLGSAFGLMGQGAQNRANMRLAEYQHNKNVEMWKMQNEYNSPSAQMERYREAGLNLTLFMVVVLHRLVMLHLLLNIKRLTFSGM